MVDDDFTLDELDDDDNDTEVSTESRLRKAIKDAKKRERALQEQVEANSTAVKKLAFIEAKLPDEPQIKYFLDHYDGDFTAEAIRTAAAENGFLVLDQESQEEVGTVQQMMIANQGGTPTAAPGSDTALMERINAVKPGPNASKQIRDIMQAAGRYESDE